jgi:ATP-dependent Clp protease protease subunit
MRPEDFKGFVWVTKFTDASLEDFFEQFMVLEADPVVSVIPIFISSYGGLIDTLAAMRDIIKSSSKPVATIALGKAMSCGACLLAAGTPGCRFVGPNTEIMVHELSSGAVGKCSDIEQTAEDLSRANKRLLTNLAEDTGHTYEEVSKLLKQRSNTDWVLTPKEAKQFGMIDIIGIPRLGGQSATHLILPAKEKKPSKKKAKERSESKE